MAGKEWNRPYRLWDTDEYVAFVQVPVITLRSGIQISVCGLPEGCVGCGKILPVLEHTGRFYEIWKKRYHKDYFKDYRVLVSFDRPGNREVFEGAYGDLVTLQYRISGVYRGEGQNGYPYLMHNWKACPPNCRGTNPDKGEWELGYKRLGNGGEYSFAVQRVNLPRPEYYIY